MNKQKKYFRPAQKYKTLEKSKHIAGGSELRKKSRDVNQ